MDGCSVSSDLRYHVALRGEQTTLFRARQRNCHPFFSRLVGHCRTRQLRTYPNIIASLRHLSAPRYLNGWIADGIFEALWATEETPGCPPLCHVRGVVVFKPPF